MGSRTHDEVGIGALEGKGTDAYSTALLLALLGTLEGLHSSRCLTWHHAQASVCVLVATDVLPQQSCDVGIQGGEVRDGRQLVVDE
jgi:hypothetical protein